MIFIVVESPTKAKAINEYLKDEREKYVVLSSYGHIRNLVNKSGSINTESSYEYNWETTPTWNKNKKEMLDIAKNASKIIIATDLDREGEGIAWHLMEMLKIAKITTPMERIVFHSVSKAAILEALKNPGEVRTGLIESYLARIGLDYLFGFSISPLLWHKVPCCKSAGRVQSVALRLIVEREEQVRNFISEQYLTVHAQFQETSELATMITLDGETFENGQIFKKQINIDEFKPATSKFFINQIKKTESRQSPFAPLITSTLLQAASNRLNLPPAITMQLAQKLYEGFKINGKHMGLITYMRTDSVHIEPNIISDIRDMIKNKYGNNYLPASANKYKSNTKAQEAHEAIRPVDITIEPHMVDLGDKKLEELYRLIWERTIASQMMPALLETTNVKIDGKHPNHKSIFELKTTNVLFAGFKIIAKDEDEDEQNSTQPNKINFSQLKEGQELDCTDIFIKEHQTQAPPRYSEATLIKQLEKKGIGRPSTYPKIISVLYEREYANKNKKIIAPTQKGWVVTAFLKSFFANEVAYEFTANLEESLDNLNQNNGNHIEILDKFWKHLHSTITDVASKNPIEIANDIQQQFAQYFLHDTKKCTECAGTMLLKITRFGAMLGCQNYPNCKNVINIDAPEKSEEINAPAGLMWNFDGNNVTLKTGPYGPYIEVINNDASSNIQENEDESNAENSKQSGAKKGKEKTSAKSKASNVKRVPVPKIWQDNLEEFDPNKAKFLASLPKKLGMFEDKQVSVNIGRFGPFIMHDKTFVSIKDPLAVNIEQAIELIEKKRIQPPKINKFTKTTTKKTETLKKPTAKSAAQKN